MSATRVSRRSAGHELGRELGGRLGRQLRREQEVTSRHRMILALKQAEWFNFYADFRPPARLPVDRTVPKLPFAPPGDLSADGSGMVPPPHAQGNSEGL